MNRNTLLLSLLSAAVLAGGCNQQQTGSEQLEKVQAETKQAAEDSKDYGYGQKAEFVAKTQSQLDEINRDLDQLAAKIEQSGEAVKAEAKPKLQALRDQTAKLSKQLDAAKNATESTWSDVKAGFNTGYGELKDGFQQARLWVSEKVAP